MNIVAIDTNALLTFRLKRGREFQKVDKLFNECLEGRTRIYLSLPALLEAEWVLRSFYKQPKDEIISFFEELMGLDYVLMIDKSEFQLALNLYKHSTGVSFTDCVIVIQVHNQKVDNFLTFDNKLSKLYQSLG